MYLVRTRVSYNLVIIAKLFTPTGFRANLTDVTGSAVSACNGLTYREVSVTVVA